MLIRLTDFEEQVVFYLDVRNIRIVQPNEPPRVMQGKKKDEPPASAIRATAPTRIITYTALPSGFQAFAVAESVEEVARLINAAWQGMPKTLN